MQARKRIREADGSVEEAGEPPEEAAPSRRATKRGRGKAKAEGSIEEAAGPPEEAVPSRIATKKGRQRAKAEGSVDGYGEPHGEAVPSRPATEGGKKKRPAEGREKTSDAPEEGAPRSKATKVKGRQQQKGTTRQVPIDKAPKPEAKTARRVEPKTDKGKEGERGHSTSIRQGSRQISTGKLKKTKEAGHSLGPGIQSAADSQKKVKPAQKTAHQRVAVAKQRGDTQRQRERRK